MKELVERSWRLVATGLCFVVFGVGGLVIAIVVAPVARLLVWPAARRRRWGQELIRRAFRLFVAMMRATGVLTYCVIGAEELERPGSVVVANHPSLIDVVLLIAVMPRTVCIVKEALWRNPVTSAPLKLAGYLANSSGPELIARCHKALASGACVLVFPEGTRTRTNQPLHVQRGAANIAVHAGADVVPVTIALSEPTLTKSHRWYQIPRRPLHIELAVDAPIAIRPFLAEHASKPLAARRLTEYLRRYYEARLATARVTPRTGC
jgi:1-acyl-sn-glycerol-3-phosphate acyltransferase